MASHFRNLLLLQGDGIFQVKPAFSRDVFSKTLRMRNPFMALAIFGALDVCYMSLGQKPK